MEQESILYRRLTSKNLLVIGVIAKVLGIILQGILGDALGVIGTICLLFSLIEYFAERKRKKL